MRCDECHRSLRLRAAVSVFLFFDRQWFPVRRWLRTDYAVFDARDARVGRPGLTDLVQNPSTSLDQWSLCSRTNTPSLGAVLMSRHSLIVRVLRLIPFS